MNRRSFLAALALCASTGLETSSATELTPRSTERLVARNAGNGLQVELRAYSLPKGGWEAASAGNALAPRFSVGQRVAICVTSALPGFLSVWSRSAEDSHPVRIYPNDFTWADRINRGGAIGAYEQQCLGDGGGYHFEVVEPYGSAEVYVHWSATEAEQFGPADIPVIPEYGARQAMVVRSAHISRTITYTVRR